jgi:hypothetical protein
MSALFCEAFIKGTSILSVRVETRGDTRILRAEILARINVMEHGQTADHAKVDPLSIRGKRAQCISQGPGETCKSNRQTYIISLHFFVPFHFLALSLLSPIL